MEKKSFGILLLIISMFLITIFSLLIMDDFKKEKLNKENLHEVRNISVFYTIESCANKYISYLMSKDYKAIYNLLDDNYINKNNITEKNVDKHIETYDRFYGLKIEEMYQYKDLGVYYVKGKLIEDGFNIKNPLEKKFKTTIKLDEKNTKFSIIPDGDGGVLDD